MILQPCAEDKCVVEDIGRCLHGWFAQEFSLPVEGNNDVLVIFTYFYVDQYATVKKKLYVY